VRLLTPRLGRPFEPDAVDRPDPWWRSLPQPAADAGARAADAAYSG
jgi:hypothetical protein